MWHWDRLPPCPHLPHGGQNYGKWGIHTLLLARASPSQAALSPSLTLLVVSGGREMAPVGSTTLLGKWMGLEPRYGASQAQLQGLVPAPPSETPALHRSGQGLGDGGRCIPASTPIPGI